MTRWRITGPGITRGAAYAVVFLFVLSFTLAALSYTLSVQAINHALANTTRAIANRASITQLCESGNVARAEQIGLWEYIIHASVPPPNETPAQRLQREQAIARFSNHLLQVFAPRNCQHPGATPSPSAPR